MTARERNFEAIAPVLATFKIHQTNGKDDLTDDNIGEPVMLTGSLEVGPTAPLSKVLGRLVAIPTPCDDGPTLATVQIGGICTLPARRPLPGIGDPVIGGGPGCVTAGLPVYDLSPRQHLPYGFANARGIVIEVQDGGDKKLSLVRLILN